MGDAVKTYRFAFEQERATKNLVTCRTNTVRCGKVVQYFVFPDLHKTAAALFCVLREAKKFVRFTLAHSWCQTLNSCVLQP